jgi:hypothetical protein
MRKLFAIKRNPKFPYGVHILCHMKSVSTLISHFLKIHLNIILLSTIGSSKLSIPFRFSDENFEFTLHKYKVIIIINILCQVYRGQWTLSCVILMQFTYSQHIFRGSVLILSSQPLWVLEMIYNKNFQTVFSRNLLFLK